MQITPPLLHSVYCSHRILGLRLPRATTIVDCICASICLCLFTHLFTNLYTCGRLSWWMQACLSVSVCLSVEVCVYLYIFMCLSNLTFTDDWFFQIATEHSEERNDYPTPEDQEMTETTQGDQTDESQLFFIDSAGGHDDTDKTEVCLPLTSPPLTVSVGWGYYWKSHV